MTQKPTEIRPERAYGGAVVSVALRRWVAPSRVLHYSVYVPGALAAVHC